MTRVGPEPISGDEALRAVSDPACGGLALFLGVVRNQDRGRKVTAIDYDAYAGMALGVLETIESDMIDKHGARRVYLAHRTGRLKVGEASVAVAASSPHRAEAFAACRAGIERIKSELPVWKKEFGKGGAAWKEEVALKKPARRPSTTRRK